LDSVRIDLIGMLAGDQNLFANISSLLEYGAAVVEYMQQIDLIGRYVLQIPSKNWAQRGT